MPKYCIMKVAYFGAALLGPSPLVAASVAGTVVASLSKGHLSASKGPQPGHFSSFLYRATSAIGIYMRGSGGKAQRSRSRSYACHYIADTIAAGLRTW